MSSTVARGYLARQSQESERDIMRTDNKSQKAKNPLLTAVLLASSSLVGAAGPVVPVVPNAGSILQQITPVTPPEPSATDTGLRIEQPGGEKIAPGTPFLVKSLRIAGTINLLNPLRHGDVLTLSGLSSGSDLTNYARIGYNFLLNGQGTHIGAAYSDLHYVLGGSLSSLSLIHISEPTRPY